MDQESLIQPGPGELDINGCEDTTVVCVGDQIIVYYTGLNACHDGQMLYEAGKDIHSITKRGVALATSKTENQPKQKKVTRDQEGTLQHSSDNALILAHYS